MRSVTEQKCSACGGSLRYDPGKNRLVCDYCGSEYELGAEAGEQTLGTLEHFDFQSFLRKSEDSGAEDIPVYICRSCGAEILAAGETISLTCPYCRNNIVLTDKIAGKLRPDGIIPFRISPEQLPGLLKDFYRDKILMPRAFFGKKNMSGITGVYLPFMVFDSKMTGRLQYKAESSVTTREGDYNVTRISQFRVVRDVSLDIRELPVDGSGKIDDALMDSLEPFSLSELKPFDISYLAGFAADRFDAEAKDMKKRAEKRMLATAYAVTDGEAGSGYDSAARTSGRLDAELQCVKYVLLPVYLFDITFDGQKYPFAVNGQTGKIVGNVPTDRRESLLFFLKRAAIPLAIVMGISLATYFLGW